MPVKNDMPRFRQHTRHGKRGQKWTSYYWDGRAHGIKDVALGSDYENAVTHWRACEAKFAFAIVESEWTTNANGAIKAAEESVALMRLLLTVTPIRCAPGVYFLLDQAGEIVYIGQSDNVLARMRGHVEKEFTDVRMIEVRDPKERLRTEARLIRLMKPVLNIRLVAA